MQILERFCYSISDALFWMLIIVSIGGVLVWMFKTISNDLIRDGKALGGKKQNEEEG